MDGVVRELAVWFTVLTLGGLVEGIDRCPRSNTCANGKCYDNSQQCNDKDDCGDDSDEWDCDVIDRFSNSPSKGFVWPWWIVGLTCGVVVGTCFAVICRYVSERSDRSLDAYLLEAPSPRPRRASQRSRSRNRSRSDERPKHHDVERSRLQEGESGIEMSRKVDRNKKEQSRTADRGGAEEGRESQREQPKVKKLPPPIPPPPHLGARGAEGGATSSHQTAIDIEPLPPPPPLQPTRAAPPVPTQQTVPPPVAPKPAQRTGTPAPAGTARNQPGTGSGHPPTLWENTTSCPLSERDGAADSAPPSHNGVQVDGYRTLQVDQRSAMARGIGAYAEDFEDEYLSAAARYQTL